MHIPIWLLLVAIVLVFVFSTSARQTMIDFFAAAWNFICYAAGRLWDFLRGAAPVAGAVAFTTGAIIGRILLFVALAIILFITILYFTLGAGIMAAGIITGHWKAALLLLTALLFWGSLSIVPSIGMFRPLTIASRYVVRPVVVLLSIYLIICTGWWTIGQIAPEMHQSANRLMGNGSTELVDLMDSKSIETEGKLGKVGRIDNTNVFVYSKDGKESELIEKGKKVRLVTSYKAGKVSTQSEGMVFVTLENKNGDFVWGDVRLIPPHRVNWDFEKTDAEAKAKAEVAAKKAEAERAAAEKAVKTVAAAAPQATPQAEVQPQKEVAKKVSPTKMLYFFDGEEKNNQIFVERFDSRTIEFVQTWKNGRKVFFSGQRSGDVFRGMYHFEDEPPQRNFVFNPQSMCGEFEQTEGSYIGFKLL